MIHTVRRVAYGMIGIYGMIVMTTSLSALSFPSATPPWQIVGGTFGAYFRNMFSSTCTGSGNVLVGFSNHGDFDTRNGVPQCQNITTYVIDLIGQKITEYHDIYHSGATNEPCTPGGTGVGNTCLGTGALQINTTGGQNTALGLDTLSKNTVGVNNTAVGSSALRDNTSGRHNTAVWHLTLSKNTVGESNTAIGMGAMRDNTSGLQNAAFGFDALLQSITGGKNTALGFRAGYAFKNGNENVFVGHQAGNILVQGNRNILIGASVNPSWANVSNEINIGNTIRGTLNPNATATSATLRVDGAFTAERLYTKHPIPAWLAELASKQYVDQRSARPPCVAGGIGVHNTCLGTGALQSENSGHSNTAMGLYSLHKNISGIENTAHGAHALSSNVSGISNTAHGAKSLFANILGVENVAVGKEALYMNTAGHQNTAVGMWALHGSRGNTNVGVGYRAGGNLITGQNNIALGAQTSFSAQNASNQINIGNSIIGTINPNATSNAANLQVKGVLRGERLYTAQEMPLASNELASKAYVDSKVAGSTGVGALGKRMTVKVGDTSVCEPCEPGYTMIGCRGANITSGWSNTYHTGEHRSGIFSEDHYITTGGVISNEKRLRPGEMHLYDMVVSIHGQVVASKQIQGRVYSMYAYPYSARICIQN